MVQGGGQTNLHFQIYPVLDNEESTASPAGQEALQKVLPKKYHGDETPTIGIKAMRELEKALKLRWSVRENFKPHKDLISRVSQSPLCSQNRVVVGGDRPHHPVLGGLGGGLWGSSTPMHHVSVTNI